MLSVKLVEIKVVLIENESENVGESENVSESESESESENHRE